VSFGCQSSVVRVGRKVAFDQAIDLLTRARRTPDENYARELVKVIKIYTVGTVSNLKKTSYSTQLKTLPNDNVSMSVGHLDHVLIVYSSMEHVTWKSPCPMCGLVGMILHPDSCTSVCS